MSSQRPLATENLKKKHEIEEAAILNFQTIAVFDFQMATRSPIFTHSQKKYI